MYRYASEASADAVGNASLGYFLFMLSQVRYEVKSHPMTWHRQSSDHSVCIHKNQSQSR